MKDPRMFTSTRAETRDRDDARLRRPTPARLRRVHEARVREQVAPRPPGWTMPVCEIDLKVGGRYRYVWEKETKGESMGVERRLPRGRAARARRPHGALRRGVVRGRGRDHDGVRGDGGRDVRHDDDAPRVEGGARRRPEVRHGERRRRELRPPRRRSSTSPPSSGRRRARRRHPRHGSARGHAEGHGARPSARSWPRSPRRASRRRALVFAHHLKMDPGTFDFEVGVPVSAPVSPAGRVKPGELPGARVARKVYTGPYEGLDEAWGAFDGWMKAQGLAPAAGPVGGLRVGPESVPRRGRLPHGAEPAAGRVTKPLAGRGRRGHALGRSARSRG